MKKLKAIWMIIISDDYFLFTHKYKPGIGWFIFEKTELNNDRNSFLFYIKRRIEKILTK